MPPTIKDLRPFVAAKDFALSQRFYKALGFTLSPAYGGTFDAELDGCAFRLQDFYVKDWAENSMLLITTEDIPAWHQHVAEMQASGDYPGMRVHEPEQLERVQLLNVIDPSGVLLIFVG